MGRFGSNTARFVGGPRDVIASLSSCVRYRPVLYGGEQLLLKPTTIDAFEESGPVECDVLLYVGNRGREGVRRGNYELRKGIAATGAFAQEHEPAEVDTVQRESIE